VASDALANLASSGVTGGALIIVGEDYGEGSSIMQQRSHAFAMKSQIWLVDPRPNLPSIVRAVAQSFELSEASNTPVMLELRIRACHLSGSFTARDNVRPAFTLRDALEHPVRDTSRIVLPPASYLHEKEKIEKRWPAAVRFIEQHQLNELFDGDAGDIGIVIQGGMYNTTLRALEIFGLADVFGASRIPLYILNVTYPLIGAEFQRFCAGKKAILIVGRPAGVHRAGRQHHPAAGGHPYPYRRQERAAHGWGIHRRSGQGGAAQIPPRPSARSAAGGPGRRPR
jgi:indolepyruvate ferredoxin oxidoreductase, alpha subunit